MHAEGNLFWMCFLFLTTICLSRVKLNMTVTEALKIQIWGIIEKIISVRVKTISWRQQCSLDSHVAHSATVALHPLTDTSKLEGQHTKLKL